MSEETDVRSLVVAARGGDEEAYRTLFDVHIGAVQGYVLRRVPAALRRKISVTDIVQETSWAGWRSIDRFDDVGDGAFRAWILKIADCRVTDALRYHSARKRAASREVGPGHRPDTDEVPAATATPSQIAMGHELADRLRDGLSSLPTTQRLVLHMVRIEGVPMAEIGRRMGKSPAAVQKIYERAKARLWGTCFPEDAEPEGGTP